MEQKKIDIKQISNTNERRPILFEDFVGQDDIKNILRTVIGSGHKRNDAIGHMLFSGASGYGKTTLATMVAHAMNVQIKIITAYALSKPAELISMLNNLHTNDILFIDEIHRLKPQLEEILYIAMEDRVVDMVLPDGGSMRLPLDAFTLIGATTKPEKLSAPLKNRFVYKFHLIDYTIPQKVQIISRYLTHFDIHASGEIIELMSRKIVSVPREIFNFCVKVRDYAIVHLDSLTIDHAARHDMVLWMDVDDGGVTALHRHYVSILHESGGGPVGVATLAAKLGVDEQYLIEDIEPLLMKLGRIDKTPRGRVVMY